MSITFKDLKDGDSFMSKGLPIPLIKQSLGVGYNAIAKTSPQSKFRIADDIVVMKLL